MRHPTTPSALGSLERRVRRALPVLALLALAALAAVLAVLPAQGDGGLAADGPAVPQAEPAPAIDHAAVEPLALPEESVMAGASIAAYER